MISIATTQLWVHDQDEALKYWTEKVGFEVRSDVTVPEMGNFRWLTVGLPGQPARVLADPRGTGCTGILDAATLARVLAR